ncbi:MAG TPA: hypothetical protein VF189_01380 [Patescibacteria group bacterium]
MKQRDLLFFLTSFCIVVLAWIAFTVVHNSLTSTISGQTLQAISPINPNFDMDTLKKIKTRIVVNPAFTISAVPTTSVTPAITPTPAPPLFIASPSATNTSTQGGLFQ